MHITQTIAFSQLVSLCKCLMKQKNLHSLYIHLTILCSLIVVRFIWFILCISAMAFYNVVISSPFQSLFYTMLPRAFVNNGVFFEIHNGLRKWLQYVHAIFPPTWQRIRPFVKRMNAVEEFTCRNGQSNAEQGLPAQKPWGPSCCKNDLSSVAGSQS